MTTDANRRVYELHPDLKTRHLPEWAGMLVYTPASPKLCFLNTTASAVFHLCEGKDDAELTRAYLDFVGDGVPTEEEARTQLATALGMLLEKSIVRVTAQ